MEIKMNTKERKIAQEGIRRAIENGKREKEEVKEHKWLLILVIVAMLYNIVTIETGSPIATICGVLFAIVMVAYVWYLDIM